MCFSCSVSRKSGAYRFEDLMTSAAASVGPVLLRAVTYTWKILLCIALLVSVGKLFPKGVTEFVFWRAFCHSVRGDAEEKQNEGENGTY